MASTGGLFGTEGAFLLILTLILQAMRSLLSSIGFLLGLAVFTAGCRQPEPAEYFGFQNLQVGQVIGGKTNISATVKLYNPNGFSFKLKRAEADIVVNGQHAGHSLLDSTIFIPAKDTFFVPVALQLDMRGVLNNALQMLMGKREATIDFDGRVKGSRGLLPFNRPFHYEVKQDLTSLMSAGAGY
jgi:LEA14-like dessication related protein